eukprot:CAMPEP_0172178888 /NCGR_PEP_ID=MMETSP1050-20130122/16297_1 /TAXON_ID=233186 /ORGANISM="Cryptomonas curvata, Strain CCAP979/52" /LENGTH=34 /DNA_ID= /DNA_START= /DNA_END= /DNA_ORIENTATION=
MTPAFPYDASIPAASASMPIAASHPLRRRHHRRR